MNTGNTSSTVEVVAPCNMEAGFTFMARTANGDDVPVTVPEGGVSQGQVFVCRSNSPIGSVSNLTELTPLMIHNRAGQGGPAKSGTWKDEWWDCFRFGILHVSLWNACFCPQLLAAQVMTRMRLDWLANPVETNDPRTFNRVLLIVCFYLVVSTLTAPPAPTVGILDIVDTDTGEELELELDDDAPHQRFLPRIIYHTVTMSFSLYTLLILTKLRHRVRRNDGIAPGKACGCCQSNGTSYNDTVDQVAVEDCCMAFFCGCCSVAQMARQTADYAQEPAACCSSTGLLVRTPTATTALSSLAERKIFPKPQSIDDVYVV